MKTANKLTQIAIAKQQNVESNICKKCGGISLPSKGFLNQLVSHSDFGDDAGNRGTTQSRSGKAILQDCMKCYACGHSWIPDERVSNEQYEKSVRWGSHQYVRYVIRRCEELAAKGYGSVKITIDCTTDLYGKDEGRNSFYSHAFVVELLQQEGFVLEHFEDFYDAQCYVLYWQPKPNFSQVDVTDSVSDAALLRTEKEWEANKLPKAPESDQIGMCWG